MRVRAAWLLAAWCVGQEVAAAPDSETEAAVLEEVVVWGRAEAQAGSATSASEGLVGYADFETRPLQRPGELVEVVPGMVATQHSGEGKANQYFLRGMNLDHGTDFSAWFEGMPLNLRAHAHGQGYLDLNFLIPEVVSTVRYAKGPYSADRGDFSTAGTATFSVYDRLDDPFVELSGGDGHYGRLVAAGSRPFGGGDLLGAAELQHNDGPWDLPGHVDKTNLLTRWSGMWRGHDASVTLMAYDNSWNSTDQVPERLVAAGRIGRFGFVDPTLGGASSRTSVVAHLEGDALSAGAYAGRYKLNLFGNFTYFLEDPEHGDQHEQVDRRVIYGAHLMRAFAISEAWSVRVGADLRYDDVRQADLYRTVRRVRSGVIREDAVGWGSAGVFAETEAHVSAALRLTAGLRMDRYLFDVRARNPANAGRGGDTNVIANLGLALALNERLEAYANWGQGFHSNDARGRTISVDPVSGDAVEPVELFVDQQGAEVGLRVEGWSRLAATVAWFWLESDSELLFVGDSGATEPGDASKRTGVEVNAFWQVDGSWTVDLLASFVDSAFRGVPRGLDHIPNAHGRVVGAGVTYASAGGWTGSVRVRHFGDAPLVEDGSVTHVATTLVNGGLAYDFGRLQLGLEVFNLFDAEHHDIAYYFESRLKGAAGPVEDVHFHPVDPLSVRVSVRWKGL